MKTLRIIMIAGVLLLAVLVGSGRAADAIMPLSEVKAGMKAKGRTVFHGSKIEQFDVEIVGVLRNIRPNYSVILARVDAPRLKDGGIVQGMSGSPVYVRGRLIGAIAFGWQYAKDGICGITPIETMIETLGKPPRDAAPDAPAPPTMAATAAGDDSPAAAASRLRPIMTPVMVSCSDDGLLRALTPALAPYGLAPVQSGGASLPEIHRADRLKPGAGIGVQLIGGDLEAVAIGTVTYRDDQRILAFGHQFFNAGRVSMPLTGAYVHAIMPSMQMSFKLAGGTRVLGAVDSDRSYGVAGNLGATCETVPCEVVVKSAVTGKELTYHYQLADHPGLTPVLAGAAVAASYGRTEREAGQTMARLHFETWLRGRDKPFVIDNTFFDDGSLSELLVSYGSLLRLLTDNPFHRERVARVRAHMDLRHGRDTAVIQSLRLSKRIVAPGDTVTVTVRLLVYKTGQVVERQIDVRVPEDVPERMELPLVVCDASTSFMLCRQLAPGAYRVANVEQMLELFENLPKNTDLYVLLALPERGMTLNGARLPDLPPSLMGVLGESNETGPEPMRGALIQRVPTDWVLVGGAALSIVTLKE